MIATVVDSNVLIDIATYDPRWGEWSAEAVLRAGAEGPLCINAVIYGEVSVSYERLEQVEELLPEAAFQRLALPMAAAFLAGKAFLNYRRRGGTRTTCLPDFLIGAHAAVIGARLLTRDASRYRTYFPSLELIAP